MRYMHLDTDRQESLKSLSGGERTKLALCLILAARPKLLLLDEPTNHLDLHMREMLEDTLAEYPGTLLLVSHDLYFMRRVCGKVLVFDDGRIKRLEYSFKEYMDSLL